MALVWATLPGTGPKLAMAIESDRQKNGDLDEFLPLQRVNGNEPKKLGSWQEDVTKKTFKKYIKKTDD